MSLNANDVPMGGGGPRVEQELLDVGGYDGRVSQVIDLGIQDQGFYEGKHKGFKPSILLAYELADEFYKDEDGNIDEERPRIFSEDMAFSNLKSERAKSTQRYNAIDPKGDTGGSFPALVGMPCVINLIQKHHPTGKYAGQTFNNIRDVTAIRAKVAEKLPELRNPGKVFLFDNPDREVYDSLPDWIKNKIKGAQNYPGSKVEAMVNGGQAAAPAPQEAPRAVEAPVQDEPEDGGEGW